MPSDVASPSAGLSQMTQVRAICCVGAGYVGGPTAAVIALYNPEIQVTVVDRDAARIAQWNSRHLPVYERGLYDIVRRTRDGVRYSPRDECDSRVVLGPSDRAPNLFFTTSIENSIGKADIVFLCVNTPLKTHGSGAGHAMDTAALEEATKTVAMFAKVGAVIVEKSTVPCGTAKIIYETLKTYRPNDAFEILSNPEFLSAGTAIKNLTNPDRILIGSTSTRAGLEAAAALRGVYEAWVDVAKIITVNLWSAELAKLVANAMLAQRISSINSISAICERTGADLDEVAKAVGMDHRIGSKFLKAGVGFGGSCFKKDILTLVYLARSLVLPEVGDYWMQVLTLNEWQQKRFVGRVISTFQGSLAGKKVAIFGHTFKKNTNDTRETPAVDVIKQLLVEAPATIAVFDPQCAPKLIEDELKCHFAYPELFQSGGGPISLCGYWQGAVTNANAIIILTDSQVFRYPQLLRGQSTQSPTYFPLAIPGRERTPNGCQIRYQASAVSAGQFRKESPCPVDCLQCLSSQSEELTARDHIDWSTVASHMKEPRVVFDGRGVLNVQEMEKLGFQVECIGKAGTKQGRDSEN